MREAQAAPAETLNAEIRVPSVRTWVENSVAAIEAGEVPDWAPAR